MLSLYCLPVSFRENFCCGERFSKGFSLSGLSDIRNRFQAVGNLFIEQIMRLKVRHNKISLNHKEWYISKRFKELRKRNIAGLMFLANSMAPWPR